MADKSDLNINSNDKVVVKSVDMADEQQEVAIQLAQTSLAKFNTEKDVAANIKKEFDRKYLPNWHCIVGRSFGSYVTHETRQFIYFYVNDTAILLFKTS